jgi:rare lipoprotein A
MCVIWVDGKPETSTASRVSDLNLALRSAYLATLVAFALPAAVQAQAAKPARVHTPPRTTVRALAGRPTHVHTIYGRSSYYAERFDGRRTASGEMYRREELTAAHLSLPFGSLVKVTNLRNGRSEVVRITDRGPFDRRFDIDVSGRAAELLGFYRDMVTRVRLDILRIGSDSLTKAGKELLRRIER